MGFRPFIFRLAQDEQLAGFVGNDARGVVIEAQGEPRQLRRFFRRLRSELPPLARIDRCRSTRIAVDPDDCDFRIERSNVQRATRTADVTVDSAVCADCLREMREPTDRRRGHALINCTQCGPRYSIVLGVPYDRPNTTMRSFAMCPQCDEEYHDVADRRFHAQPIACRDCGPTLSLVDSSGDAVPGEPIEAAHRLLVDGKIVAIKGIGGFHLACRADLDTPVQRLRDAKHRLARPFAVMARDATVAASVARFSERGLKLLSSPAAPIVLAPRRDDANLSPHVAPGLTRLGVMLPYTPIQHLLFDRGLPPLVMTSANDGGEPLVTDNADALRRLAAMCDAILMHDRDIARAVDDSVLLDVGNDAPAIFLRRARGYVPAPLAGRFGGNGVCTGGDLKGAVAVVRPDDVILSQHLGDLENAASLELFSRTIVDLLELFDVAPQWVAHDLHPRYGSTHHAHRLAERLGVPLVGVQHHHAHAASVMAEHGIDGPVLAVVCDGTGFGDDGTTWGGELLRCDALGFTRLASLLPIPLPGGDAAARQVTRTGLSVLRLALGKGFERHPVAERLLRTCGDRSIMLAMLERGLSCPLSSGAGRWFDAIASILGLCERNSYEAEAAMRLEAAADRAESGTNYSADFGPLWERVEADETPRLSLLPFVRHALDELARGVPTELLALRFHEQFAAMWTSELVRAASQTGLRTVVLSGGVMCNARLIRRLTTRLTEQLVDEGFKVLRQERVPPNDGGLALGQALVASARWRQRVAG